MRQISRTLDLVIRKMILNGNIISMGGVVVYSKDGSIMCRNTLDLRLLIAFEKYMPDIRAILAIKD